MRTSVGMVCGAGGRAGRRQHTGVQKHRNTDTATVRGTKREIEMEKKRGELWPGVSGSNSASARYNKAKEEQEAEEGTHSRNGEGGVGAKEATGRAQR